jgi:hypothetical protein
MEGSFSFGIDLNIYSYASYKNSIFLVIGLVIGTVLFFGALLWIGKPTEKFETTSHANNRKESVQRVTDALAVQNLSMVLA